MFYSWFYFYIIVKIKKKIYIYLINLISLYLQIKRKINNKNHSIKIGESKVWLKVKTYLESTFMFTYLTTQFQEIGTDMPYTGRRQWNKIKWSKLYRSNFLIGLLLYKIFIYFAIIQKWFSLSVILK